MMRVHLAAANARVERARASDALLLCTGAVQEASARVLRRREVQDERPKTTFAERLRGRERRSVDHGEDGGARSRARGGSDPLVGAVLGGPIDRTLHRI